LRPSLCVAMRERFSAGARQHDGPLLPDRRLPIDPVENSSNRLDPQHHSGAAAKGWFVGAAAFRELVEQVMVADVGDAVLHRATDDGKSDERRKELRKERDDVDREHGGSVFRDDDRFACALEALDRRDFSSADAAFAQLLALERLAEDERAFLLNKRGVARMGLELRELARADFAAALKSRPGYPPALTNLGNLLLEEGQVDAAIANYESAIAGDREYAIAYFNLGVAYKRTGRIAKAVRALRHAQRLEQRSNAGRFWPARRP
jgi:tetratricopeptide (TPR) repeat protein